MRSLVAAGLILLAAGCQQRNAAPEIPSVEEMRPAEMRTTGQVDGSMPSASVSESVDTSDLLDDLSSDEPASGSFGDAISAIDTRSDEELLAAAEEEQRVGNFDSAIRLVKKVILSGEATPEQSVLAASILVRSKDVRNGIELLEQAIRKGQDTPKVKLMLISALRVQAKNSDSLRLVSARRSAELAMEMQRAGDLVPYGVSGQNMLLEVLATHASVSSGAGMHRESIDTLKDLSELGVPQFQQLCRSPAFEPLRELPEFQAVVRENLELAKSRIVEGARELMEKSTPYAFEFSLKDYTGQKVSSDEFKGKIMVVDLWGTWCPPCRKETPELVKLQKAYPDDVAVVGIAYEKSPRATWNDSIKKYVEEHGVNYPSLVGDAKTKNRIPNMKGFPTLLFVDRAGKVRLQVTGFHDFDRLDTVVNLLMKDESNL